MTDYRLRITYVHFTFHSKKNPCNKIIIVSMWFTYEVYKNPRGGDYHTGLPDGSFLSTVIRNSLTLRQDISQLERVQRPATRSHTEKLCQLCLFSLERRCL